MVWFHTFSDVIGLPFYRLSTQSMSSHVELKNCFCNNTLVDTHDMIRQFKSSLPLADVPVFHVVKSSQSNSLWITVISIAWNACSSFLVTGQHCYKFLHRDFLVSFHHRWCAWFVFSWAILYLSVIFQCLFWNYVNLIFGYTLYPYFFIHSYP